MDQYQWIPLIPTDDLPHDLNLMARKWIAMENGDPNFIQTVGHAPETLRRYIRWSSPMWRKGYIQHRVKELCRIRIAESNECRYCKTMRYETTQKQGITEELVSELQDFENGEFTDAEKAALRFTDEVYMDNITWEYDRVPDDVYARLQQHFDEPQIVELTWAVSVAIEYGRNFTVWDVPVTEEKTRESLDDLQERVQPKFDPDRDEANRAALEQIAQTQPADAEALRTLLAKPEMLGPVIAYYRYVTDEGVLEPELKQAVKARVVALHTHQVDGSVPGEAANDRIAAALAWTDGMAVDFSAFVDNTAARDEIKSRFTDQEMVELGMYSGFSLILRRVRSVLDRRLDLTAYSRELVG